MSNFAGAFSTLALGLQDFNDFSKEMRAQQSLYAQSVEQKAARMEDMYERMNAANPMSAYYDPVHDFNIEGFTGFSQGGRLL